VWQQALLYECTNYKLLPTCGSLPLDALLFCFVQNCIMVLTR
jgi:hypothetical protein